MFKLPRGTRDFTPDDMWKRRHIETMMRTTFQQFGYREVQTPTFETLELFTAKSGDAIIDELYSFADKSGRELALRPELTAPVIRFYVDKLQMEPKPLKLCYFGNCYRYDRPQKGRYREFHQAGCELIGVDTPEAYAELIALAYTLSKHIGLKTIHLHVGNLTILSSMFDKLNIKKESRNAFIPLIDKAKLDDVESLFQEMNTDATLAQRFLDILQDSDPDTLQAFLKDDHRALDELAALMHIMELLQASFAIQKVQLKMSIVRGLDYYKGLVFEIDAPVLGAEKQLCGGGVYELIPLFGGRDIPTAGFAIGFDRALLALETEQYQFPAPTLAVYVIPVNDTMITASLELVQTLRNNGISTDIDLLRRGMGKSLKHAAALHATKAVIVGPKELEKQAVTLRDMHTGDQSLVPLADIVAKVKQT